MPKVNLEEVREKVRAKQAAFKARLFVCASTGCIASGCKAVMEAVLSSLKNHDLEKDVEIVPTGCMGLCSHGPLIRVEVKGQEPVLYTEMDPMLSRLMVAEHLEPALKRPESFQGVPEFMNEHTLSLDTPFFTDQVKVVLENSGRIVPENIDDYIADGGYQALERVFTQMTPDEVIREITASGLRGRGGGGFPTGKKWELTAEVRGAEKFMICNGDEGDPGAYMDRSILEGNPHAVIEGMLIAGYAIGATAGWFYVRAEYPLAVERLDKAIKAARRYNLLGKDILGSGVGIDLDIRLGAGAFVCGEETALIASIEGKRGNPTPRPPYPSQKGLWGMPSCVNNVETLANVPTIIRRGGSWFASMGTATSKGTKVFALTGKVNHSGLIEVPMGISLRRIVESIGGGSSTNKQIKAVQTGGPSGGVIPKDHLDLPVCYEELKKLGSIMGSGGMIVMDEDDDMVDIAKFYLGFTVDESCGKCAPCRIGGKQLLGILEKITNGYGAEEDLEDLHRLSMAVKRASLCGLGQTAPNPVISTLQFFPGEYKAKLRAKASGEAVGEAETGK
ncbi:MAG: NAD(P)H-dependent oxidoreductase subunit E [Planctomycetota bacterium]|jgi:NADH:ubiquinone oxidoreductase subunit F (NADH-binding)/(2Fe-2S) ferredoxin|nr:NAD(P)H-dependent oxidoreductase subunit E [Planctomycetota bacterium]